MNTKVKEPDRTHGGTFYRDKDGKLLEHIPPTKPVDGPQKPEPQEPDAANPQPAKKGKE